MIKNLNLLPYNKIKEKKKLKSRRRALLGLSVVAFVVSLLVVDWIYLRYEISHYQNLKDGLASNQDELNRTKLALAKAKLIADYSNRKPFPTLDFLFYLSKNIPTDLKLYTIESSFHPLIVKESPSGFQLTKPPSTPPDSLDDSTIRGISEGITSSDFSAIYKNDSVVVIRGSASTVSSLGGFIESLKSYPYFLSVNLPAFQEVSNGGKTYVLFELYCVLDDNVVLTDLIFETDVPKSDVSKKTDTSSKKGTDQEGVSPKLNNGASKPSTQDSSESVEVKNPNQIKQPSQPIEGSVNGDASETPPVNTPSDTGTGTNSRTTPPMELTPKPTLTPSTDATSIPLDPPTVDTSTDNNSTPNNSANEIVTSTTKKVDSVTTTN